MKRGVSVAGNKGSGIKVLGSKCSRGEVQQGVREVELKRNISAAGCKCSGVYVQRGLGAAGFKCCGVQVQRGVSAAACKCSGLSV